MDVHRPYHSMPATRPATRTATIPATMPATMPAIMPATFPNLYRPDSKPVDNPRPPMGLMPVIDVSCELRGGQKARENDIFIAVMGLTGAGKSTFISHLTKSTVQIGDKLQSCTREVSVYQYQHDESTNVYLVDTPGFDDTNLSDSDVLREIATWLTWSYNNEVKLKGIIYLHRITDPRMGGSAKKNLFMFKKLCGPDALNHVVLVTTMWEQVYAKVGGERQAELENTEDFWGYMLKKGSRVERHVNTRDSARRIVGTFLSESRPSSPVMLAIQNEMVNEKKGLDETEAGKGLDDVLTQERERFRRELDQVRQDMEEAIKLRDAESQEELAKQQAMAEEKLQQLRNQQKQLKIDMEKLHKQNYEKLEAKMNRRITEVAQTASVTVERVDSPQAAWNRTTSLSLSGDYWAFTGPKLAQRYSADEVTKTLPIPTGDKPRLKRLLFGESRESFYSHYHTGSVVSHCHNHGHYKDSYPGLFEFLCSKEGRGCPKFVSLGPKGSYFVSMGKRNSFKCHPNAIVDDLLSWEPRRLWWGYDGSFVMERADKLVLRNLRGHYGILDSLLKEKPSSISIQELALDINGPDSYAIIFSDGKVKYHVNGTGSRWGTRFKDFTAVNFGVRWEDTQED